MPNSLKPTTRNLLRKAARRRERLIYTMNLPANDPEHKRVLISEAKTFRMLNRELRVARRRAPHIKDSTRAMINTFRADRRNDPRWHADRSMRRYHERRNPKCLIAIGRRGAA